MKKRWVLILIPAVLAFLVFSDRDFRIRLMPRSAVRSAVLETADVLNARFAGNPVLHIASSMNWADQALHFHFPEENGRGVLHLQPRILSGVWAGERLNARFFADGEGIAAASDQLTAGKWYGIRYDSFAQDISQIPLISWILSESLLRQWESGLSDLQARFLAEFGFPAVPSVSREDLSRLTFALASMKAEVKRTAISLGNSTQNCLRIHFRSDELLSPLLPRSGQGDAACTFYLRNGQLILTDITAESEGQKIRFQLESEGDPATDPIRLLYSCEEAGKGTPVSAEILSQIRSGILTESWTIRAAGGTLAFSYRYDPASGAATVSSGESEPAALLFHPGDEGFHLETGDFPQIAAMLFAPDFSLPDTMSRCILDVHPDSAPERPEFLTPKDWSTEDLLTLLEGLGSVLNIPFP